MSVAVNSEPVPLNTDADGALRVGGTRVSLDAVVAAFGEGATAEAIVQRYPVLQLADVYTVIGYNLRHLADVNVCLDEQTRRAVRVRQVNEARFDPASVRDRLVARRVGRG